jgi:fumarate reductase flavoprotein subunit
MEPAIIRAVSMPAGAARVPVAIVGAGACGLAAALMLRDAGVDCVLLERDAQPQGSTALSSGFIPAAGTAVQLAAGVVDDSAERFAADIQAKAHGTAARHLVAAYTGAIAPAMDALQARHGLGFELLDGFVYPGHSVLRMHTLRQRTGAALVASLDAAAARAGALMVTDAVVRELWCDEPGRVLGVAYRRPDGTRERVGCDVLLLACNGFGGNTAMVHELLPEMRNAPFAGHAGNDGSAITWGTARGRCRRGR